MSDTGANCQHKGLQVDALYNMNVLCPSECGKCGSTSSKNFQAIYRGHELQLGQMCGVFERVVLVHCRGCGELLGQIWEPCGDGWTSDLFTQQRESVEIDTRQSEPAEVEGERSTEAAR